MIDINEFGKLDLRVGTIIEVEPFPEAQKPAYKLTIDLGPAGRKQSSAQLTDLYPPESLVGRQIVAVINFPPKRIAGFKSEVLVLGVADESGAVVLLEPDSEIPNGAKVR